MGEDQTELPRLKVWIRGRELKSSNWHAIRSSESGIKGSQESEKDPADGVASASDANNFLSVLSYAGKG